MDIILIHRLFAGTASLGASEEFIVTMWTMVPSYLLLNPFFGSQLLPGWNSPHNHFLSHGHRKIVNQAARPGVTLVTALVALFLSTRSDWTDLAVLHSLIRQAAIADYVLRRQTVNSGQFLLEFLIIIAVRHQNTTNTAI
jgi:hypothetical protein